MLHLPKEFTKYYWKGEEVLREGDSHDNLLYILIEGTLGVYKGEKRVSEIKETGVFFGEMSLLLDHPIAATVKSETDSIISVLPYDPETFFVKYPHIARKLLRTMVQRVAEMSRHKSDSTS